MRSGDMQFIDLFAGIGGFRLGFEQSGFECVFSCEKDNHAQKMYQKNFNEVPHPDIKTIDPKDLLHFDILLAGFPCQAFSRAGKMEGFEDTRGTLFFEICRILKVRKPKVIVLENVKNLKNHDSGKTFDVILQSLYSLGYTLSYEVLSGKDFGVPQNRERIIIVGVREGKEFDFSKVKRTSTHSMQYSLEQEEEFEYLDPSEYTLLDNDLVKRQKSGLIFVGYRNKKIRENGTRPNTNHLSRVHKQPNRIYSELGIHPTLSAGESSGRYWILTQGKVRKLTMNECFKMFGYPQDFKRVGPKSQLYKRIGNTVVIPMIKAIADQVRVQYFNGE